MSARRAAPSHRGLARAARALACAALAAALAGCASSRPLLASHGDYAAYRATRVSRTLDERLAAASAYLARYPDGAFAGEVRVYLARAEPVYYASKRGSAAGLTAYLAALPRGAFSADARFRLGQLIRARNTGDLLSRAAQETEARLAKERAERERVREELTAWLRRFLDGEAWGRPLAQAPAEVVVPFSLTLPAPTCAPAPAPVDERAGPGALVCAKRIELPFTVKAEGEAAPRAAQIEIAILEDAAGRPIEVAIRGPELFTRLEEARSAREVAPDDPSGRIGGISLAVELARAVFQDHVSADPSCGREVVAPVVLHLECGGARLVARAAADAGEEDALTITASAPAR
ncbi:tetratricopeptide repeat protein [Sorangium sp. So ce131]|uniref:tetratricopeptide repeat protein n=1 Tax=Sorangium sp. So ce131 TaxID=3133282 RepID=UPI003F5ECF17